MWRTDHSRHFYLEENAVRLVQLPKLFSIPVVVLREPEGMITIKFLNKMSFQKTTKLYCAIPNSEAESHFSNKLYGTSNIAMISKDANWLGHTQRTYIYKYWLNITCLVYLELILYTCITTITTSEISPNSTLITSFKFACSQLKVLIHYETDTIATPATLRNRHNSNSRCISNNVHYRSSAS